MQIERIEEMRLTADDEVQIGALLDAAFGGEYGGRSYFQQRHHLRFVMRDAGHIIGHIAVCLRAIRMDDLIVQIAGLGDIATDPSRRGRGIASNLMTAAIDDVRQSIAQFFVLFGDQPLYTASGFVPKGNVVRAACFANVSTGETMNIANDGLMVMALSDLAWDDSAEIDLVGHAF